MPPRPVMKDYDAWNFVIMEHRRALLERLIAEFPELLETKRVYIDQWRVRLSGPKVSSSDEAHP